MGVQNDVASLNYVVTSLIECVTESESNGIGSKHEKRIDLPLNGLVVSRGGGLSSSGFCVANCCRMFVGKIP